MNYRTGPKWVVHFGYGLVFYLNAAGQVVSYHKEGINSGVSSMIRHFPAQTINVVLLSTLSAYLYPYLPGSEKRVGKIFREAATGRPPRGKLVGKGKTLSEGVWEPMGKIHEMIVAK